MFRCYADPRATLPKALDARKRCAAGASSRPSPAAWAHARRTGTGSRGCGCIGQGAASHRTGRHRDRRRKARLTARSARQLVPAPIVAWGHLGLSFGNVCREIRKGEDCRNLSGRVTSALPLAARFKWRRWVTPPIELRGSTRGGPTGFAGTAVHGFGHPSSPNPLKTAGRQTVAWEMRSHVVSATRHGSPRHACALHFLWKFPDLG